MINTSEIFQLEEGYSFIDLRGDGFDTLLLVGGKPIAMNWLDCGGSVAQYLARAGRADCENELQSLRHTLEGNWLPDVPISSQIFPFLELFVPGRYHLHYSQEARFWCGYEFDKSWKFEKQYGGFYPSNPDNDLVFTQPTDSLNPDRIAYFIDRIEKGHRPIALIATVEHGWCSFVLDGHHKLQAYKRTKVTPTLVSVCRLDAPELPPTSFDEFMSPKHPLAKHYRKNKGLDPFDTED